MIAFMVKDNNKCRKSRVNNSIANAGYTWLLTFVLHLIIFKLDLIKLNHF